MIAEEVKIRKEHTVKLLSAANPDAALLYIYLQSGNELPCAESDLGMSAVRLQCATAALRQAGLWQERKPAAMIGERPAYSEQDVICAASQDLDFRGLYTEVQKLLGRSLNTEELKILLGFVRYLGMPAEVVIALVCYCKDRASQKGSNRNPSLRTIEKEAYAWAEQGIDTLEDAIAYTQAQSVRYSRMGRLKQLLQLGNRKLSTSEERYVQQWLDWGFDEEAISMAYDKTCVNTGGLKWPYMHKILTSWQQAGLLTGKQVRGGDRKPAVPKGASGQLGEAELEAIQRVLREG